MKKIMFFHQLAIVLCLLTAVLAGMVIIKVQIVSHENARLSAELATKDKALAVALAALDEVYASAFDPDTGVSSVEDISASKRQENAALTPIGESAITVLEPCAPGNKATEFGFVYETSVVYMLTVGIQPDAVGLTQVCGYIGWEYLLNVSIGAGGDMSSGQIQVFSLETNEEWVIAYQKNAKGGYVFSPSSPGIQVYAPNPFEGVAISSS
jgi:hypothetical protein